MADVETDASEDEVNAELQTIADQYQIDVEKLKQAMNAENLFFMAQDIKMKKAIDFMFENAIVE